MRRVRVDRLEVIHDQRRSLPGFIDRCQEVRRPPFRYGFLQYDLPAILVEDEFANRTGLAGLARLVGMGMKVLLPAAHVSRVVERGHTLSRLASIDIS